MFVRAGVRKSGVREEKILFCLETYEIICHYAKIKFLAWPHEPEKDLAAIKPEILMFAPNQRMVSFFFFIVMSLYIM